MTAPNDAQPPQRRWTFQIGDAFPANDVVAQFLVSLASCLNDLVFVSKLLAPEGVEATIERSAGERQYFLRLSAAHLCELVVLVRDSYPSVDAVRRFVDDLPPDVKNAFDRIRAIAETNDAFHKALFTARNHIFHYPVPGGGGPRKALQAAAELRSGLTEGDRLAEFRADFADEVAVQFWDFARDEEELRQLLVQLLPLSADAHQFIGAALDVHLSGLPEGVLSGPD